MIAINEGFCFLKIIKCRRQARKRLKNNRFHIPGWQACRSRLCQKEKEQSRQSKAPDHKVGESQGGQEPHLGQREGDQSGSMERREFTMKEGRF